MFIPTEMFGKMKYRYHPDLGIYNLVIWSGLYFQTFSIVARPEITESLNKYKQDISRHTYFVTDKHGFKKTSEPYNPEHPTILFGGDSFTEGLWVSSEETFVSLFGQKLREQNVSVNMVNMGVNGYSALETAWMIETYAPGLNPKMIVINLLPNDVHGDFIKVIKGEEDFEPNYKQMFQYLERIRTYCTTMGIQFVVAVIPSKEQISVMKEYGVFQDRVKSWCDEKEVPFADPRAYFNTFDWEQLYFTWDPHFSPLGHKHYSDFLYEFTQTMISNEFQPDALN